MGKRREGRFTAVKREGEVIVDASVAACAVDAMMHCYYDVTQSLLHCKSSCAKTHGNQMKTLTPPVFTTFTLAEIITNNP